MLKPHVLCQHFVFNRLFWNLEKGNCGCAVSHPLSVGRSPAAGEAEDCTKRIWFPDKVEMVL